MFQHLKQHWKSDLLAGFMVSVLALPLCLGIAKASGFPPVMGVFSAILGGIIPLFFSPSESAIKGPAAGLITICAATLTDLGGGEQGWMLISAAIVVMSLFQMALGIFRLGGIADFFPRPVVQGLLSAIGLIIVAKQLPVLLGLPPEPFATLSPLETFFTVFTQLSKVHLTLLPIGLFSLIVMFLIPWLGWKKVPAPLVVLLFVIPWSMIQPLHHLPDALVQIGNPWDSLQWRADFSGLLLPLFWKGVFILWFVSSLESVLVLKAVDQLDPWKRESPLNGDLIAQGASNFVSGWLGGLPVISEVLRSSVSLHTGGRTRWANAFHALFLFLAICFCVPLLEKIPNAALAAMLIFAGYRLASPQHFKTVYQMGWSPFLVFLVTVFLTLSFDLLYGVAIGMLLKFVFHLAQGARLKDLFRVQMSLRTEGSTAYLSLSGAAAFTNIYMFKKKLQIAKEVKRLHVDAEHLYFKDHSFLQFFALQQKKWEARGVEVITPPSFLEK